MEDDLKNGRQLQIGSGENFGLGRKFWVGAKILGSGRKLWVRAKILGSGENFGFG